MSQNAYAPLRSQPEQAEWMGRPQQVVPGCPPGLEYLLQLDQLLVHQQVEILEVATGLEMENRYAIKNSLGQQCYFATEESDACHRFCCKSNRGFSLNITDNTNQVIMRLTRPFKCCAGLCWCADKECCAHTIEVESPVGTKIGSVKQAYSSWKPSFEILNENDATILKIKGPCCVCSGVCCTDDYDFNIFATDGTTVGAITKQYGGFVREAFTSATNFSLQFPMDLDVKMKAVLLSATFLIDMMYFERKRRRNRRRMF